MKVKAKNIDKIKIKVNHQEFMLLLKALKRLNVDKDFVEYINAYLFDKDEFETVGEVYAKVAKMIYKMEEAIEDDEFIPF